MWSNPFPHKKIRHPLFWLFCFPTEQSLSSCFWPHSNTQYKTLSLLYIGIDPLVFSSLDSNLQKRTTFLLLFFSFWQCSGSDMVSLLCLFPQVKDVGFEIIPQPFCHQIFVRRVLWGERSVVWTMSWLFFILPKSAFYFYGLDDPSSHILWDVGSSS